jgi:hypothetical protein
VSGAESPEIVRILQYKNETLQTQVGLQAVNVATTFESEREPIAFEMGCAIPKGKI